jgi:hypothetical protein
LKLYLPDVETSSINSTAAKRFAAVFLRSHQLHKAKKCQNSGGRFVICNKCCTFVENFSVFVFLGKQNRGSVVYGTHSPQFKIRIAVFAAHTDYSTSCGTKGRQKDFYRCH